MSLNVALATARSSLETTSVQTSVISRNISGATEPSYTRKNAAGKAVVVHDPSPEFLAKVPRNFRDTLPSRMEKFREREIKPKALAWEEQGYVPRDVLRRMGSLGFFGIRYPARYGGSEMDTLASVVLAEELGRSTFTGVSCRKPPEPAGTTNHFPARSCATTEPAKCLRAASSALK